MTYVVFRQLQSDPPEKRFTQHLQMNGVKLLVSLLKVSVSLSFSNLIDRITLILDCYGSTLL